MLLYIKLDLLYISNYVNSIKDIANKKHWASDNSHGFILGSIFFNWIVTPLSNIVFTLYFYSIFCYWKIQIFLNLYHGERVICRYFLYSAHIHLSLKRCNLNVDRHLRAIFGVSGFAPKWFSSFWALDLPIISLS